MWQQDRFAGGAGHIMAQLLADHISRCLGHATQGGGLAAGDRDKALHTLIDVVEALERSAQFAAGVGAARADERPGGRPGGAELGLPDSTE